MDWDSIPTDTRVEVEGKFITLHSDMCLVECKKGLYDRCIVR